MLRQFDINCDISLPEHRRLEFAGYCGEHKATRLAFIIPREEIVAENIACYIEYSRLSGERFRTEYLSYDDEEGAVIFDIPRALTGELSTECALCIEELSQGELISLKKPISLELVFLPSADADKLCEEKYSSELYRLLEALRNDELSVLSPDLSEERLLELLSELDARMSQAEQSCAQAIEDMSLAASREREVSERDMQRHLLKGKKASTGEIVLDDADTALLLSLRVRGETRQAAPPLPLAPSVLSFPCEGEICIGLSDRVKLLYGTESEGWRAVESPEPDIYCYVCPCPEAVEGDTSSYAPGYIKSTGSPFVGMGAGLMFDSANGREKIFTSTRSSLSSFCAELAKRPIELHFASELRQSLFCTMASLNESYCSYDAVTGELSLPVGADNLDGSEDWQFDMDYYSSTATQYYIENELFADCDEIICSHFPSGAEALNSSAAIFQREGRLYLRLPHELQISSAANLKAWLQECYEEGCPVSYVAPYTRQGRLLAERMEEMLLSLVGKRPQPQEIRSSCFGCGYSVNDEAPLEVTYIRELSRVIEQLESETQGIELLLESLL